MLHEAAQERPSSLWMWNMPGFQDPFVEGLGRAASNALRCCWWGPVTFAGWTATSWSFKPALVRVFGAVCSFAPFVGRLASVGALAFHYHLAHAKLSLMNCHPQLEDCRSGDQISFWFRRWPSKAAAAKISTSHCPGKPPWSDACKQVHGPTSTMK